MLPHTCVTLSRTSLRSVFRWRQTSGFALRIKRVRCRCNILGAFSCSGYFEVSSAASSDLPFTYQRILSCCSRAQTHLKWARELFRSSSLGKSAIILGSLKSRRSPSVHLRHSENRTSRYPRLLSVRPGRQISYWKRYSLVFDSLVVRVAF